MVTHFSGVDIVLNKELMTQFAEKEGADLNGKVFLFVDSLSVKVISLIWDEPINQLAIDKKKIGLSYSVRGRFITVLKLAAIDRQTPSSNFC